MSGMRKDSDGEPSIHDASTTYLSAIRQSWLDEAERRMALVRAGKMRLIDADEVLDDPNYD